MEESSVEVQQSRLHYEYNNVIGTGKIRVLTLEPGHYTDPLSGNLLDTKLLEAQDYEAISYVWGKPTRTDTIILDGKILELTSSLASALKRFRYENRPRKLWADQICINQQNIEERSDQVKLMGQLYQNTKQVLVWLGHDPDGYAPAAVSILSSLRSIFEDPVQRMRFRDPDLDFDPFSVSSWKALEELYRIPWFHRAWIPQEIGTAAPAQMLWGETCIDWEALYVVTDGLDDFGLPKVRRYRLDIVAVYRLYKQFVAPPRFPHRSLFVVNLMMGRRLHATDPRDYVFALLGHFSARVNSGHELIVEPHYDVSVENIYHEVAVRTLETSRCLWTLNAVVHTSQLNWQTRNDGLPTWVPQWDEGRIRQMIGYSGSFDASLGSVPEFSFTHDAHVLRISGIVVDTAATMSRLLHADLFSGIEDEAVMAKIWERQCGHQTFNASAKYPAAGGEDQSALWAFLDTMSASFIPFGLNWPRRPLTHKLPHMAHYLVQNFPERVSDLEEIAQLAQKGDQAAFLESVHTIVWNRKFITTRRGYYALGPDLVEEGDVLCVLFGSETPAFLRPVREGKYIFVGECYVYGLMFGEAMEMLEKRHLQKRIFEVA